MRILIDATLPCIEKAFPKPFIIQTYDNLDDLKEKLPHQAILVCRSTLKVSENLLKNSHLQYVATASSGIDHIDKAYLQAHHITLIDAKGSNTHSVADYVLSTLAALARQIKLGKKVGVIGYGAVGTIVAYRLKLAGFQVKTYDPPLALRGFRKCWAKAQPTATTFESCSLTDLQDCEILCMHAAFHEDEPYPSKYLLNQHFFANLKPETVIINAARGGIVNEEDLLKIPFKLYYCTDVYQNEPSIDPRIIDFATFCTPHIAGHSIDAKEQAVWMVSQALHAQLGLKLPSQPPKIALQGEKIDLLGPWQSQVLKLYDPSIETQILKRASNKQETWLDLRSRHNQRHDFLL